MTKNSKIILEEARHLNLDIKILSDRKHLFVISGNGKEIIVRELFSMSANTDVDSYHLSKDKDITYLLWKRDSIPFPPYLYFKNQSDFLSRREDSHFDFPVIIKESNGSRSKNVIVNISSISDLENGTKNYPGGFVVQQMASGSEYRLLIYKGKLLGALRMIPPHVVGNGKDSIENLILEKNSRIDKKIIINETVERTLQQANFHLHSIPKREETIFLQRNSCLSEGGSTEECSERVHKEIIDLAWRATKSVNLNLGGVDMICSDISLSPQKQNIYFLEVNTYPDLYIHYHPSSGNARFVARDILSDIFNIESKK